MIRAFREGDEHAWCEVINENLLKINSKDYPREVIIILLLSNTPEQALIKVGERVMLVAEVDGKIVGTVSLTIDGEVKNLFVKPSSHANGVGRELLTAIEKEAVKQGFSKLFLYSSVSAQEFYGKTGYAEQCVEWEEINNNKYKVVLMTKEL